MILVVNLLQLGAVKGAGFSTWSGTGQSGVKYYLPSNKTNMSFDFQRLLIFKSFYNEHADFFTCIDVHCSQLFNQSCLVHASYLIHDELPILALKMTIKPCRIWFNRAGHWYNYYSIKKFIYLIWWNYQAWAHFIDFWSLSWVKFNIPNFKPFYHVQSFLSKSFSRSIISFSGVNPLAIAS